MSCVYSEVPWPTRGQHYWLASHRWTLSNIGFQLGQELLVAPGNLTCNRGRGFFHLVAPWVSLSDEKVLWLIVPDSHFTGCSLCDRVLSDSPSVLEKHLFSHLLIPFLLIASPFPHPFIFTVMPPVISCCFFEVLSSSLLSLSKKTLISQNCTGITSEWSIPSGAVFKCSLQSLHCLFPSPLSLVACADSAAGLHFHHHCACVSTVLRPVSRTKRGA